MEGEERVAAVGGAVEVVVEVEMVVEVVVVGVLLVGVEVVGAGQEAPAVTAQRADE